MICASARRKAEVLRNFSKAFQWRRDFPQKWRRKIPQSGGSWRSAVWVIGSSVFWRSATVFQGRRNGIGGGVRLEADRLGQQVGVLAQPIARPLDLDDDGVGKEPGEERGRHGGIPEYATLFGEAGVGSGNPRALFVSGVDELEEEIAAARRDGE